jgi:SAM-dependent methyltransferase
VKDVKPTEACAAEARRVTEDDEELKRQVRATYAEKATAAAAARDTGCCSACDAQVAAVVADDDISRDLYSDEETSELPQEAVLASAGCGNPTALAELRPGEMVLDLGSGGGIDVLLSARRVAPGGKAYGLDMTDEMLALARENQREAGVTNVEFLKGEMEEIPLPGSSVDVIISNCVVNLSPDKDAVLAEAFRVLRPGGRLAISDMVFQGDMGLIPRSLLADVKAWSGCIAGALEEQDYLARLRAVGFVDADIEVTRVFDASDVPADVRSCCGTPSLPEGVRLVSGFVRALKPTD